MGLCCSKRIFRLRQHKRKHVPRISISAPILIKQNETSMDPDDYDPYDIILQHLNQDDILQASIASSSTAIVKSEQTKKSCLDIIKCEEAVHDGIVTTVLECPRKYQNVFTYSHHKRDIIVSLSNRLTNLIVETYDVNIGGLDLSNLRTLELDCEARHDGLMNCVNNLEDLGIKSIKCSAADSMIHCLQRNERLKQLRLGLSPCLIFNGDRLLPFNFQLTHLQVKLNLLPDLSQFFEFLRSQASSLQHFSVDLFEFNSEIFNFVINNMENLKTFKVYSSFRVKNAEHQLQELPNDLSLRPNRSIKEIVVQRLILKDLPDLESLLLSVPNLKSLEVFDSTEEAFDLTVNIARKLETFRTVHLNVQVFDEICLIQLN